MSAMTRAGHRPRILNGSPAAGLAAQATGPAEDARAQASGKHSVSIEIANESGVTVDEAGLAALARHVLDGMRVHPLAELSVLLVDEAAMADLHQRWMGEAGPTDVLAFPMDELWPPPPGGSHADHGGDGEAVPGPLGGLGLWPPGAVEQDRQAQHTPPGELDPPCAHR